jgi:uncharacterized membrane protein YjgN (DUF898 family)
MTKKGIIIFNGNFLEYFFISIFLLLLSAISFGLVFPYYLYWSVKYFVSNLSLEIYDNDIKRSIDY